MFKHSQLELKLMSFFELHDVQYVKDFKQVYFTSTVEFHKNGKPKQLFCYIDFYLPVQDVFIEVKGWNPKSMESYNIKKHFIIEKVSPKKYYVIKTWSDFTSLWEQIKDIKIDPYLGCSKEEWIANMKKGAI